MNWPEKISMIYCKDKVVDWWPKTSLKVKVVIVRWKRVRLALIQAVACTCQALEMQSWDTVVPSGSSQPSDGGQPTGSIFLTSREEWRSRRGRLILTRKDRKRFWSTWWVLGSGRWLWKENRLDPWGSNIMDYPRPQVGWSSGERAVT